MWKRQYRLKGSCELLHAPAGQNGEELTQPSNQGCSKSATDPAVHPTDSRPMQSRDPSLCSCHQQHFWLHLTLTLLPTITPLPSPFYLSSPSLPERNWNKQYSRLTAGLTFWTVMTDNAWLPNHSLQLNYPQCRQVLERVWQLSEQLTQSTGRWRPQTW